MTGTRVRSRRPESEVSGTGSDPACAAPRRCVSAVGRRVSGSYRSGVSPLRSAVAIVPSVSDRFDSGSGRDDPVSPYCRHGLYRRRYGIGRHDSDVRRLRTSFARRIFLAVAFVPDMRGRHFGSRALGIGFSTPRHGCVPSRTGDCPAATGRQQCSAGVRPRRKKLCLRWRLVA